MEHDSSLSFFQIRLGSWSFQCQFLNARFKEKKKVSSVLLPSCISMSPSSAYVHARVHVHEYKRQLLKKIVSDYQNCKCLSRMLEFPPFCLWSDLFLPKSALRAWSISLNEISKFKRFLTSQEFYLKIVFKSTFSTGFLKQYTKVNILKNTEKILNILTYISPWKK